MKITKKSPSSSVEKTVAMDNPSIREGINNTLVLSIATGKYLDIIYYIHLNEKDIARIKERI